MSKRDAKRDAEAALERLAAGLREDREPSEERIASLRREAERRREGLLAREAMAGRRTRRRGFLLAGASASAGVAVGVAGLATTERATEPPTEAIALSGARSGVRASAELINHTWGVELLLTVSGLEAGRDYDVVYRATDGPDVAAGSFVGVDGEQLCRMTGALLRPRTQAIEVQDRDGSVVLRSQLA